MVREQSGVDLVKTYVGGRSLAGAEVMVDGKPLDPRYDLKRLSPTGFEWTYEGNGPAQFALALLADHLGDDTRALGKRPAVAVISSRPGFRLVGRRRASAHRCD